MLHRSTTGLRAKSASAASAVPVGWAIAAGTANSLTADYTPAVTALTDGLILGLRGAAANTSERPSFSPDDQDAYPITRLGGEPLLLGDIQEDHEGLLRFREDDTGSRWELLNPASRETFLYEEGEPDNDFLAGIDTLAIPDPNPAITFLQSIATLDCAAVEHFVIPGTPDRHFIAVCNFYNPATTGYNLNVKIYEKDGDGLYTILYQTLVTSGANSLVFFTRNSKHYLAIANYNNNTTYNVSSTIIPWSSMLDQFDVASQQSISTKGCQKIKHVLRSDDSKHYLVFANSVTDGNLYRNNSVIYVASDGDDLAFTLLQNFETNGGYALTPFKSPVHSSTAFFMATAEFYNDNGGTPPWIGHTFPSRVVAWNGTTFETGAFTEVTVDGATDSVHCITADGAEWIAWAASQSDSSFEVNSKIYKYTAGAWVINKHVASKNANSVRYANLDNEDYLIFSHACSGDSASSDFTDSHVDFYKYTAGAWVLSFTLPGIGAYDCVAWEDADEGYAYAFVANSYDGVTVAQNSKLYRLAITV